VFAINKGPVEAGGAQDSHELCTPENPETAAKLDFAAAEGGEAGVFSHELPDL
jgi:hypothetical protein